MEEKDIEFLSVLYAKILDIEKYIKEEGYEHRILSASVYGLMDDFTDADDDEMVEMKSLFSYNLDSAGELDIVKKIMDETYEDPDSGLNDLLNGLGISLN